MTIKNEIAEYGLRFLDELTLWQPREEMVEKIKALITTRELLVRQKTATLNSRNALHRKAVKSPAAIKILGEQDLEDPVCHDARPKAIHPRLPFGPS